MARLMPELDSDEARAAVGRTMAALEGDCSQSCPRGGLICDCRLRAVRALNALKLYLGEQPLCPGGDGSSSPC
jgi:hypothetical protein